MNTWDDLRIFLSVAREETLSAAGRMLRMDPATVSRRVARLEEQLGLALFAKSPTGYALTEAGGRLVQHAERAEQAVRDADAAVAGIGDRQGLSGQVRIGAPDGCANFVLPRVLAQISNDNPDLDVQIVALPRVVNLSRREADLAITVSPPTAMRLSYQKISDYKLHLAATNTYLAQGKPVTQISDLRDHNIVGYIPDMIFDKELDYLSDLGVERVALASNSASVQLHWLRQHAGIGIAHDFALPFAPGMRRVLQDQVSLKRSFYMVRHADDRRLERMNTLARQLAEGVRAEIQRLEGLT